MTYKDIMSRIEAQRPRSKWNQGVKEYAVEMLEAMDLDNKAPENAKQLRTALLNGADSWKQYSESHCAIIYDDDIMARLCTKSERKRASAKTDWLSVQTRALYHAFALIVEAAI